MTHHDDRLEAMARRLGRDAADRVDPEGTAQAVVARLRVARPATRWWPTGVLRVAAAVIVLVSGVVLVPRLLLDRASQQQVYVPPAELEELAAADLVAVLDSLKSEAPVSDLVSGGLNEMSETELRELLLVMEGD